MTFADDELTILRATTSRILLSALWLHVPLAVIVGMTLGKAWWVPAIFMAVMASAASMSWWAAGNGLRPK